MKPRIRIHNPEIPCIKFICTGDKQNRFHCAFGETEEQAYKAWAETEPRALTDQELEDDVPF